MSYLRLVAKDIPAQVAYDSDALYRYLLREWNECIKSRDRRVRVPAAANLIKIALKVPDIRGAKSAIIRGVETLQEISSMPLGEDDWAKSAALSALQALVPKLPLKPPTNEALQAIENDVNRRLEGA